jgi:peptidoglycan/LPS O-acetylase OafA/YrhL
VLFCFSKIKLNKRANFTGALAFFFIGSMVLRYILINNGSGTALRTITLSRLDSIACGVTVSFVLTVFNPKVIWKQIAFVLGICLALTPVLCVRIFRGTFDELIQNPIILLVVPLGFSLTLPIVSGLKKPLVGGKIISTIVKNLSLWSYSIYLSHLTIMWEVYHVINKYRSHVYVNFLSKVIGLTIVLFISSLLFKYFEKPLTAKRPAEID